MERYQIILGYDGTAFGGMQRQMNARTIQGEMEEALRKIGWRGSSLLAAGRTDAGVHASGQVVAFDHHWPHSLADLRSALNANLPPEIAVRQVREAAADFHPRFDALARTYEYRIISQPVRDPLRERFAWRVWPQPDFNLLQTCAGLLVGEHDFSAFGTLPQEGGGTIRLVFQAGWVKEGDTLSFTVTANAFLYHMVRRLVHIQVEIGLRNKPLSVLEQALRTPGSEMIQGLAPSHGLFLTNVTYPE
ncbi:MAG: tRNA pseudouridine(38-40) synthase TruA [Anaerolineales bacterium]|nr:tRNA pseudouridine(38-40) synthase TruA [Anaerolineales bacterium]